MSKPIKNEGNFKEEFMQALEFKDKKLNNFLSKNFNLGKTKIEEFEDRCASLSELTDSKKKLAKARLKQFEERNDASKKLPFMLSLAVFLFVIVTAIYNISDGKSNNSFMLVEIIIFSILILYLLFQNINYEKNRDTAVYVKELLKDIL